ncbi:MAG: pimeloyl-ACP methyl ester esterase BioH, partial [Gammaproteobacteria bacterium]
MTLHTPARGSGTPLLMLHGWGMHGGIWNQAARELAGESCRTIQADLPGHGHSPPPPSGYGLEQLARACAPLLEANAIVMGWSLGGMVAMELARQQPQQLRALILVGSTPRFTAGDQWPHGLEPAVLTSFAQTLKQHPQRALQHFLTLQLQGCAAPRPLLRRLQQILDEAPPPRYEALAEGLKILRHSDLLPRLAEIRCPVLIIHGEQDSVVPWGAGRALQAALPNATLQLIPGAGHAPFLSHHQAFCDRV